MGGDEFIKRKQKIISFFFTFSIVVRLLLEYLKGCRDSSPFSSLATIKIVAGHSKIKFPFFKNRKINSRRLRD